MPEFSITAEPIDCAGLSQGMQHAAAGAFVGFEGRVRDHNDGLPVIGLDYEVFHDMARQEGLDILNEAVARFRVVDARAIHREGALAISECAVWVGVIARHRGEAFAACGWIMDTIKQRLPVWKKEHYVETGARWVNAAQNEAAQVGAAQAGAAQAEATPQRYYSRQTRLPELGDAGQARLAGAKVLVVGVGGLGCAAATALAGAGIGHIVLADGDRLALENLHRQTLYAASDVGRPKAELAAARLRALNPFVTVDTVQARLVADNAETLIAGCDLVLDCTDNFATKYLLNDAAILFGVPVVQASIYRFEGQLQTIDPADGHGCLRCRFPEPPPPGAVGDCVETGVLGTVPMLFGTLQANEAIRRIAGIGEPFVDLLLFDMLSLQSRTIRRERNPDCPLCSERATIHTLRKDDPMPDASLNDNLEYHVAETDTLDALHARFTFLDVREDKELREYPVPDAVHMPLSAFDFLGLPMDRDAPVLAICAGGVRSLKVTQALRAAGWSNVVSLSGGWPMLPAPMLPAPTLPASAKAARG